MKYIRNFILIASIVGTIATLLNTDVAFAADGVAQAENALKGYIKIGILLAGIVGVGFVVIGAIKYASASGHPDRMEKAKDTIIHALIGVAIALGAYALVDIVASVAKSAFGS